MFKISSNIKNLVNHLQFIIYIYSFIIGAKFILLFKFECLSIFTISEKMDIYLLICKLICVHIKISIWK